MANERKVEEVDRLQDLSN